jgi:Spx/MgsR family transcriptional regulator
MYALYGIKNCDKVKAARKWLEASDIEFTFIDIRDNPVSLSDWKNWIAEIGVDKLINRRSTTWKQLPEDIKQSVSESSAAKLLAEHPTLMKRPLLISHGESKLIGFSDSLYSDYFNG